MDTERILKRVNAKVNKFFRFVDKLREHGLEYYERYYSVYPAYVAANEDPEGRDRIKVRVPMLDFPDDSELPNWALPRVGMLAPGQGKGGRAVPDVGDMVFVEFLNGDINSPIYSGGTWANGEMPAEFEYITDRGFKTSSGHVVRFRDEEGEESLHIEHKGGGFVDIDADGVVRAESEGGDKLEMDPSGSSLFEHRGGSKVELGLASAVIANGSGAKIELNGPAISITAPAAMELKAQGMVFNAASVGIGGKGAVSPIVKGDQLATWLQQLLLWLTSHGHPPPAGAPPVCGPSPVPPPPAPLAAMLNLKVRT